MLCDKHNYFKRPTQLCYPTNSIILTDQHNYVIRQTQQLCLSVNITP